MPMRFPARKRPDPIVTLNFPNGESVSAPQAVWIMALYGSLDPMQQRWCLSIVENMTIHEKPTLLYGPNGGLMVQNMNR